MSDRDRRLRAVEDEEREEHPREDREEPRPRHHEQWTTVDHTSTLWRLVGVISFFGALAALGYYLETVGLARQFATVTTVTALATLGKLLDKRPDLILPRVEPYDDIVRAYMRSRDKIRRHTYDRPIRVVFLVGLPQGVAVALIQTGALLLITNAYSWQLAVFFGGLVGAVVVAPQFFIGVWRRIVDGPADVPCKRSREDEEGEDGQEDDDEQQR